VGEREVSLGGSLGSRKETCQLFVVHPSAKARIQANHAGRRSDVLELQAGKSELPALLAAARLLFRENDVWVNMRTRRLGDAVAMHGADEPLAEAFAALQVHVRQKLAVEQGMPGAEVDEPSEDLSRALEQALVADSGVADQVFPGAGVQSAFRLVRTFSRNPPERTRPVEEGAGTKHTCRPRTLPPRHQ
jgi:hypothetical protein